jgi:hypothetical protein
MVDKPVLSAKFEDGISAAADAAAASLKRLGVEAATSSEQIVRASTRSAASLRNSLDPISKAARDLQREMARLAQMQASFAADSAKNADNAEANNRALASQAAKIDAVRQRLETARAVAAEFTAAQQGVTSALAAEAEAMAKTGLSLDSLRSKWDERYRVSRQYSSQLEELAVLEKAGGAHAAAAAVARDRLTESYARANAGTREMIAGLKAEAEAMKQVDAARNRAVAPTVNAAVGVDGRPDWLRARAAADRQADLEAAFSKQIIADIKAEEDAVRSLAAARAEAARAVAPTVNAAVGVDGRPDWLRARAAADRQADLEAAFANGDAIERKRAAVDSLFRASKAYEAELQKINALEAQGAVGAGVASRLREEATQAFSAANQPMQNFGNGLVRVKATAGEVTFAMRQMGVQSVQMVSGIATGQPVLMTMIQQMHQMVDVALATGTGFNIVTLAAQRVAQALMSPLGVIGGLTAAMAYFAYVSESTQRQFNEMSARLRVTREDYALLSIEATKAAKAVAGTGVAGTGDALAATRVISSTPEFRGGQNSIEDLTKLAVDVARAFDEDLTAAAGRVAAALRAPKDAAQSFADQGLRGMNQALADSIARMQDSGRFAEAQAAAVRALRVSTEGAHSAITPLQKALEDLSGAFNQVGADGKSFGSALGEAVTDSVAGLVKVLAETIRYLKEARDFLNSGRTHGGGIGGAPGPSFWPSTPGAGLWGMISTWASGNPQIGPPRPNLPASTFGIMGDIASAAGRTGVDQMLLARLQASEGLLRDGQWVDSSTGRVGPMQVSPNLFAGMQRQPQNFPGISEVTDLRNPTQNVQAGAIFFAHLLRKYGDPTLAVLAYHDGETVMDAVLAGRAQNSPDALKQALKVTSGYSGTGLVASQTAPATATAPNPARPYGTQQQDVDRALKLAGDLGSGVALTGTDKIDDRIAQLTRARSIVEDYAREQNVAFETIPEWRKLTDAINSSTGARYQSGDAIQQLTRRLTEQLPPLQAADGAARALADANNELEIAARSAGRAPTQAERAIVEQAALTKLSAALREEVAAIDRSARGQEQVAAAYDVSYQAGVRATEQLKAEEAARKVAVEGKISYITALNTLTDARMRDLRAAADGDQARRNLATQDEIDFLRTEARLIGATTATRERELAVLRERQRIMATPGADIDSQRSQAALRLAAEKATTGVDLSRQQQAFNDLANVGVQAFDRIGAAITEAFANGSMSALDFGKIGKAVLSELIQYVLRISVLNPVLNSLFGGGRTTITDTIGSLGQVGQGSSGLSLSGISGGGLLGLFTGSSRLGEVTSSLSGGSGVTGLASLLPSGISDLLPSMSSVSSFLGPVMAGFGLGSLAGSFVAKSQAQRTNSMIGAGLGSLLLGPLGGLAGGVLGGLIGPKDSVKGYGFRLQSSGFNETTSANEMSDSLLPISRQFYNATGDAMFQAADTLVAKVNEYMTKRNLLVGGVSIVGGNKNGADYSWADAGNLSEAFTRLRFASKDNAALTASLAGKTFDDPAKLEEWVEGFLEAQKAIDALSKAPLSNFLQAMADLNTTFDNAVETANKYGLSVSGLEAERARRIAEANTQAAKERAALMTELDIRDLTARGLSNQAAVVKFDAEASRQFDDLIETFKNWYGDAYGQNSEYQAALSKLTQVIAEERDAVVNQNRNQARTQVAGVVDSLRQFGLSLQSGAASALSPQQQYALASQQFNTVATSALAGDFKALQDVQGYASAFLNTSRVMNGSGAQYASDYNAVMSLLQAVANADPNALTASAMAQIQQTATETLTAALAALGTTVAGATTDAVSSTSTVLGTYTSAAQIAAAQALNQIANDNAALYARVYAEGVAQLVSTVSSAVLQSDAITQAQYAEVAQQNTDRVVVSLGEVREAVNRVRQEIQMRESAPAGYGGGGGQPNDTSNSGTFG